MKMLGLNLREEFRGRRLRGTAIELTNSNKTGAADIPAADFLEITYPSIDLLKTIEAVGPDNGRTVVLKGERGQGKSHLMATIFHAMNDPTATTNWLDHWQSTVPEADSSKLKLRGGMHVITAMLHKQRFKHLWDLLFDQHPHGEVGKALWENEGANKSNVPSDEIMLKMFQHTPCCLILDEFQTWFDGLRSSKKEPEQVWAFNFIQTLSEIADEHPDLLVLVASIRNGNTDAFHQLRRVNPIVVDFTSTGAKYDRQRLLLHRLFENRRHVEPAKIESAIQTHIAEYLRLSDAPSSEHEQIRQSFIEAWPYAPHLMSLLEDQVLIATQAQETRDLIRILADLFKDAGGKPPILTAAHFRLDDDSSTVAALLSSVANTLHDKLREKAIRNIQNVRDATASTGHKLPHLEAVISSLWLRSLADVNQAGADRDTLHIDVTSDKVVDDTPFEVELNTIVENSWNIHDDGGRYIFKQEENPQAKLIGSARNDKLFTEGDDLERLSLETRKVIVDNPDASARFRVIVMPQHWRNDPWEKVAEADQPTRWADRIPVLVLPECPSKIEPTLGTWLRDNLQKNRNAVRFLLPRDGSKNLFADRDLVVLARCVLLAERLKAENAQYGRLMTKYQKELRDILKSRFDRFAIISNWNFQKPENCHFFIESHKAEGAKILDAIDKHIQEHLFIPEEFSEFFQTAAEQNQSVGKLVAELREPRPSGEDCIPWLGETLVKENITRLCARDKIAVNVRGNFYMQRRDGEDEEQSYKRLRGQLPSGSHLDECHVLLPQNVPTSGGGPKPETGSGDAGGQTATGDGTTSSTNTLGGTQSTGGETTGGQTGGQTISGTGTATPGDLFGGSSSYSSIAIPTTSALNLLGKIESNGIAAGSQLRSFKLQVDSMTGAQLQELIKKLPDGMKYQLDVEKEQSS